MGTWPFNLHQLAITVMAHKVVVEVELVVVLKAATMATDRTSKLLQEQEARVLQM